MRSKFLISKALKRPSENFNLSSYVKVADSQWRIFPINREIPIGFVGQSFFPIYLSDKNTIFVVESVVKMGPHGGQHSDEGIHSLSHFCVVCGLLLTSLNIKSQFYHRWFLHANKFIIQQRIQGLKTLWI